MLKKLDTGEIVVHEYLEVEAFGKLLNKVVDKASCLCESINFLNLNWFDS